MNTDQDDASNLVQLTPIRVETGFSRYPIHRLAKHGDIAIDIREESESGEVSIKWEVNHISKFQPGPLAYKLDTLIINRKIEEAPRPVPRAIRLGSLKEIAAQLGLGGDTNLVKKALRQNASAFIIAKIRYKCPDGSEKKLEADFNRYSVLFTGEKLPDGRKADAVYIIINDVFMQVINGAMTRPLDYDYLKFLPPASQRFYELLSFQMYATIKNDRPRAKLLYSEFCRYAPLKRHTDWNDVRSQLTKIHAPHKKSSYITKIDYQQTTDSSDQPDWIMFYTPGPKARAEFQAFTRRNGPDLLEIKPLPRQYAVKESALAQLDLALPTERKIRRKVTLEPQQSPMVAALVQHGVTEERAAELAQQYAERVELQIAYLEWEMTKKPGKIGDPAAYLVKAIERNNTAPKGFLSKAEAATQDEAKRLAEEKEAQTRRSKQQADREERRIAAQVKAHYQSRTAEQLAQLQGDALALASEETRRSLNDPAMKPFRDTSLKLLVNEHIARLIFSGQLVMEPA